MASSAVLRKRGGAGLGGFQGVVGSWGECSRLLIHHDFGDSASGMTGGWGDGSGEIVAGEGEAVEEEGAAFVVDAVIGDAAHDFAEEVLDGVAIFGMGEVEVVAQFGHGAAGGFGRGHAGGVVVVAEGVLAQAGAAALAAGGEDVAAAAGFLCG